VTYLEFNFTIAPLQPASDILIAELGELGFDSFVEKEDGLLAYVIKEKSPQGLEELFVAKNQAFKISWSVKEIKQKNWNQEWEKNFHPIKIEDRCRVRAPFHTKEEVLFDIVIEPKMSFGTGHHETTHMMLQLLLDENLDGDKVLDMGCGTGVLAILARMKGAENVEAIDIDEWSYENTLENVERNNCSNINVQLGNASLLGAKKFHTVIANINRNVLLEDIPKYISSLEKSGSLFLSGFYLSDLDMISAKCRQHGLEFEKKLLKNNWVAAKYVH